MQIIVLKLQIDSKPTNHPGKDVQLHDENTVDSRPYITAEFSRRYAMKNNKFIVGDDQIYSRSGARKRRNIRIKNVKLQPETYYSVFQRTFKSAVSDLLNCNCRIDQSILIS